MTRGAGLALPLLPLLLLAAATGRAAAQDDNCTCPTNKMTTCSRDGPGGRCQCRALGSGFAVDCSTLTAKCLLLKARAGAARGGRRLGRPGEHALLDSDGLYDPDCERDGRFRARQCNGTAVCWCVNSGGVRRTDKGDRGLRCDELVRTHHILIDLRHRPAARAFDRAALDAELRRLFRERYGLQPRFVAAVRYEQPAIRIELRQDAAQKGPGDVDIADAAYYFERDVQGESLFPGGRGGLDLSVRGEPLQVERTLIYYLDEKPPQFSMKRLTGGLVAVIVVVALALAAGVAGLVITRRRRSGKYRKVELKELGELRQAPSL